MQHHNSKNGGETETAAHMTENPIGFPEEADAEPGLAHDEGQNAADAVIATATPVDSAPENQKTGDETIPEAPIAAENRTEMPESANQGDDVSLYTGKTGGNSPSEVSVHEKTAELEAKCADLTAQLADSADQLLRKAADFENFRKRMNQEKQSAIEFANQSLLLDIIPIIDDFERAIQSAQGSEELIGLPAGKAMLDGITMIEKRLSSQLESKWGLKRFNAAGELFDPNRHEALYMEKSPDVEEAMVQESFIKGYTLKDRVIRAAKVKVLVPENGE